MDTTKRKQMMIALRKKGHTLEYIGKQFKVSRQRVCQIIGKTGRRDKIIAAQ